jgi:hypothetical protein
MRKMILMAVAGFLWKKFVARNARQAAARNARH